MENLLQGIAIVVVYLDDILIIGPTNEAHFKNTRRSTNQNGTSWVMSEEELVSFYGRFSCLPGTQNRCRWSPPSYKIVGSRICTKTLQCLRTEVMFGTPYVIMAQNNQLVWFHEAEHNYSQIEREH